MLIIIKTLRIKEHFSDGGFPRTSGIKEQLSDRGFPILSYVTFGSSSRDCTGMTIFQRNFYTIKERELK